MSYVKISFHLLMLSSASKVIACPVNVKMMILTLDGAR